MRDRKLFMRRILAAAVGVVVVIVLAVCRNGGDGQLTLEKISYDKSKENPVVYIKENGEYVPYLVLTSDYGGNVLLLRENVLPEEMPYKTSSHGEGGGALSAGWTYHDYGAYYEESSIDRFLNTEFLDSFSLNIQETIADTAVEVMDKESFDDKNFTTHKIKRKVFLLSAVELGVKFGVDYTMAKEGKALKYFKNKKQIEKKAYKADGTAWPYWTRTPWVAWETYTVTVIGASKLDAVTADRFLGVRPAFCMEKDTVIQENNNIVAGKSVYTIKQD